MYKLAFGILIAWTAVSSSAQASTPIGRWRTQMHGALVDIKTCAGEQPCAYLAWIDPKIAKGATKDVRNPDPALRSRPLIGLPIVWGLRGLEAGWNGGSVYNPETGQTFKSSMTLLANGKLKVTGCWGILCRSEIWVRAA